VYPLIAKEEPQEQVSSPKGEKHKTHKHKKEDSKSSMKRSRSERTGEKHKKEKKTKSKRSRSNSHGNKSDHTLALSAPATPVKGEHVSIEKAPDTCPKRKEKESKVTRESRSTSMPEKKFKLAFRRSHKSKSKVDEHKTSQSVEVAVHPVVIESTMPRTVEISPKSPKEKSSKKSPKTEHTVSMPVQPKKEEDLKAIADFYIETGLQTEGKKQKEKKVKEKKDKKKEKKNKRPKSSRRNAATSTEVPHAYTAPELGRYTSAEELFEINRRLVEGESDPKIESSPSNIISLSGSGSGVVQHNYAIHIDTISNVEVATKDDKPVVAGTSYAANYLTSPPSAAVNYLANPNIDHGVDVESNSEEQADLDYQTAVNRKMYTATTYSNYGADDLFYSLNESAYGGQALEDIEVALEAKPISKVQGPISLSKMALRPQVVETAQTSGSGINWGEMYMKNIREMTYSKDRMLA